MAHDFRTVKILDKEAVTYLHEGPLHFEIRYFDERTNTALIATYKIGWDALGQLAQLAWLAPSNKSKSGIIGCEIRPDLIREGDKDGEVAGATE